MAGHPRDGGGVEQRRVVEEIASQAGFGLGQVKLEVESRHRPGRLEPGDRQRSGRRRRLRDVLKGKDNLKEWVAARIAVRMQLRHQFFEGHLLVGERVERNLADAAEQIAEGRVPEVSARSTSMLTKNPISGSSSVRVRPAIGAATTRSSWPVYRCSSAWNAASNVMNSVTRSRRLRDFSTSTSADGRCS